jgi:photosystem II stability/assembly factor-like uncharacterized protein
MARRYPKGTVLLLVGTKRGLFLFTSRDRRSWKSDGQIFPTSRVFNAVLDQRLSPRVYLADNGDIFGSVVKYSDDFGSTWREAKTSIRFSKESGRKLENVWIVEPGRPTEPETIYAGVDPASLWVSTDRGESWEIVDGLERHPTRDRWEPGLGGLCLHSIVPDPTNADRMWVAISAVGVMRTDDGGRSWTPMNRNVPARHLPAEYPEFGQCVHRLVQHPKDPETLYQQNHFGIFATRDGARDWIDIQSNLPSYFGFPMAIDRRHPDTIYVVVETEPLAGRHNIGDQFAVYRTDDAGKRWRRLTKGLPKGPSVRLGVLRHAMATDAKDPVGVYVGTNTGQLFSSPDRGDSWKLVADFLPQIYSVTAAVLT